MKKRKIGKNLYWENSEGVLIPEKMYIAEKTVIKKPCEIVGLLTEERTALQERFIVITLDAQNAVIKKHVVTIGILNQSQIHPRETFRVAILDNAASIIIAHNHPSGCMDASHDDLAVTKRLVESGNILGIKVLDHLIITVNGFTSIRSEQPEYFR